MAEHEDWTTQDDALLRSAMTTLRHDVEAQPLADARFVRARGTRRRRQQRVVWAASVAAAAVVVGSVASAQLGQHIALPVPPATSSSTSTPTATTSAPTATSASLLDRPGALPLPQEWAQALGLQGQVRATSITATDHECLTTVPLGQTRREEITVAGSTVSGGQTRFAVSSALDPATVAEGMASDIAGCSQPRFVVTRVNTSSASPWPRLYSYTAGNAGSGWFAIAPSRRDVTLLQVVDSRPGPSTFTQEQVGTLAAIATARLARYGTGAQTPSGTTTLAGPPAVNEQMPVSGVAPLISSRLFIAASQWASPGLTAGRSTSAGPGQPEGGLGGVVQCETDAYLSGVAGRYGIVRIRAGQGAADYIGVQRVRLFEDVDAASLVAADLARSTSLFAHGCTFANGTVRVTPGPSAGTYRLDTVFADGSPTASVWVGVTAQHTQGVVSTVVITKAAHPTQAFAELDRLLALARQK